MSIQEQHLIMESETRNSKFNNEEKDKDEVNVAESKPSISTQLYLRSSSSSKPLDKEVVLGRIQRRKCMNKVKNTLHSLLSLNGSTTTSTASITQDQMWVDLGDAFSCP
ncbi:hypothetical protein SOVF_020350 [Spinacia oleracea]|uniref:Uncharacterized protein n=1 Tax=Spinacia oleracea TaxID=3562 RepID=A0A9R0IGQ5_SPIOL|nr:uncharacterized protein LOC110787487 [Spinacia oleracea]KNA23963.1 hypothetical protein SOVF_020350 [Spinacia oleracea]